MEYVVEMSVPTPPEGTDGEEVPSTLNPQPQTLNPQPSTLNPRPSTLNPQPQTLIPKPLILNRTLDRKP